MGRKGRRRLRRLDAEAARAHPHIHNIEELITAGSIWVDGRSVTNPASLVPVGASIVVRPARQLRGEAKLRAALLAFRVPVAGRIALDLGAAAGGFTRVLLEFGASRVYAVDAGYGQLVGSLRQDSRVVNLEGVNLGLLDERVAPERVELITIDLSYLAVASAVSQLDGVAIAEDADLVALVKPMFELGLASPPARHRLSEAVARANDGVARAGWEPSGVIESPVRGARGATEFVVHARRKPIGSRQRRSR